VKTLRNLRELKGPRFLHVVTRKGKGYKPAEGDPCVYHGVTPFDPATGKMEKKPSGKTYTQVFGDWLCDMAAADPRLVGHHAGDARGLGPGEVFRTVSDRYFDVGIAEQHSAHLRRRPGLRGLKPVVAIYSTFLQRAYDQLIHDICLQNLPVLLAIDRGGLVGPDGPTHAGSFDLAYLRCLPNMTVMAPADENECRQMLSTGFPSRRAGAVRYPRGTGPGVAVDPDTLDTLPVGKAEMRRRGRGIALLAFGSLVAVADVAAALDATVVNMRFVKPLDEELIRNWRAAIHCSSPSRRTPCGAAPAARSTRSWRPRPAAGACSISACRTASSNTASATSCSPSAAWMPLP
jgi:1-deoxy-D-xylulose-5-phosphate synthase